MGPRAPGTNHPLHRREKKALERLEATVAKYVAEGMDEAKARERAQAEMRKNPKADWRRG
jgi:hypothetical protein